MRNRTPLALLTLAGLLAMTAPTATALCADDGQGGCSGMTHALVIDVEAACPEGASLCVVDGDPDNGTLAGSPTDASYDLTLTNKAGVALDFEVFATGRFDDPVSDAGEPRRMAATLLLRLEDVAPGESREAAFVVDGVTSHIRLQAVAADGRQAEADQELLNIRALSFGDDDQSAEDLADDSGVADDDAEPADGRDAPYLGIVVVVGVLAAIVGLRRYD